MPALPFKLDLAEKSVVVVGAGPVASRRVHQLLASGAIITVIAPDAVPDLQQLADTERITWLSREFDPSDLATAWLAVTATGNPAVDASVQQAARNGQVWCINSGQTDHSDAEPMMSVPGPENTMVAVSGGRDPGRARNLINAIGSLLDSGQLPLRRTRTQNRGRVTLLGAGPGDPELLTIKAARALAQADVLVVDRLAPAVLWEDVADDVTVIDVGKQPTKHAVSQDEINKILVREASAGKHVVRIKGGDPFVLGRGGEEALECIAAGIPVEVIPGITSAISVPAAAGIPVTHRGITSTFVVASAHEGPAGVLKAVEDSPHTSTLVLLMGAGKLPKIAEALVATGRSPDTPLAIVESGWTADQHTTVTSLGEALTGTLRVQPPAVVVIGDVVALRDTLGDLAQIAREARHA